ncbi:mediator-associated protein 2 [Argentina anserina]|uniref:mediator-associated protein 2 n=1 Tax=Argentina anserina TaxID=57926 RepID=UPI0021762279|nr:mediator-associated protein 2 [Potentilla anserina]XP_050373544.1 mediator-associated protein 2 [Potentilla anserina]
MGKEQGYKPPEDFEENGKDPLVDFDVNDSTELWLIQWPKNQNPDYDGKELTLKLQGDGKLSTFEGASGKEYDLVSSAIQESNATVFVSSSSGTKIAGKISRRVSLVHYPEPSELKERQELQMAKSRKKSQISSSMAFTHSSQKTPSRSTRTTTTATPTQSTFQRDSSHLRKKRHASPGGSHSGVTSSGQGRSTTTSSGERSSKKHKEKHKS